VRLKEATILSGVGQARWLSHQCLLYMKISFLKNALERDFKKIVFFMGADIQPPDKAIKI